MCPMEADAKASKYMADSAIFPFIKECKWRIVKVTLPKFLT